jgi:hypothetical protein
MLDRDRIRYADFLAYAEAHDGKFAYVNGQIIAQAKADKAASTSRRRAGESSGQSLDVNVRP